MIDIETRLNIFSLVGMAKGDDESIGNLYNHCLLLSSWSDITP